jgi:hypothetical protein
MTGPHKYQESRCKQEVQQLFQCSYWVSKQVITFLGIFTVYFILNARCAETA